MEARVAQAIPALGELFNDHPRFRMSMEAAFQAIDASECAWGNEQEFRDGRDEFGEYRDPFESPNFAALSSCMNLSEVREDVMEDVLELGDRGEPLEQVAAVLAVICGSERKKPYREFGEVVSQCLRGNGTLLEDEIRSNLPDALPAAASEEIEEREEEE
jgi:hypothetical protein